MLLGPYDSTTKSDSTPFEAKPNPAGVDGHTLVGFFRGTMSATPKHGWLNKTWSSPAIRPRAMAALRGVVFVGGPRTYQRDGTGTRL